MSAMKRARAVVELLLQLPIEQRKQELQKLKQTNKLIYALVFYNLNRELLDSNLPSSEGSTVAADTKTDKQQFKLIFENKGRLITVPACGMHYDHQFADGTLRIDELTMSNADMTLFKESFSLFNKNNSIILVRDDNTKTVFSPPISLSSIHSSATTGQPDKTTYFKLTLKFVREIVTLNAEKDTE